MEMPDEVLPPLEKLGIRLYLKVLHKVATQIPAIRLGHFPVPFFRAGAGRKGLNNHGFGFCEAR